MSSDLSPAKPVRVVIVDDTRSIRAMIRALLGRDPNIEVVGEAGDPYEARELIRELDPDVITLDVVMPRMDGLAFLERIMKLRPMPVVMASSRTTDKSREAVKALALGAFDCVDIGALSRGEITGPDLAETVTMAAKSRPQARAARDVSAPAAAAGAKWNGKSVVIGSSTGGVDALLSVLAAYPADGPPTVIAQHMPAHFLESFTRRLDRSSQPVVQSAEDGMEMEKGHVYVAPGGDAHVAIDTVNPRLLRSIPHDGTETYVPSVNVLFSSAVPHAKRMVGVMLTGMGNDGAAAMLRMRQAGAYTIVQDSASAIVDGMPRAARENGSAAEVAGLSEIGSRIVASTTAQENEAVK